jgi:hypothetical protein
LRLANVLLTLQRAGYLANYEIYNILAQAQEPELYGNVSISQYEDEGDVLIHDETNWVSWLSLASYVARRSWTDGLNFGVTSDWAIDLNQTYANNGTELLKTAASEMRISKSVTTR